MRPIPVQKPRFDTNSDVMMLDGPEMTLELTELAQTTSLKDPRTRRRPSTKPSISPDFLLEMCSAASMIMDHAEIEAMLQEIELARKTQHIVAA